MRKPLTPEQKELAKNKNKKYYENNKHLLKLKRKPLTEEQKEAAKNRSRKYYHKNKKDISDKNKIYVEENKENVKQYQKEYRKVNREKNKQYLVEYYKNNKKELLKKQSEYQSNNKVKRNEREKNRKKNDAVFRLTSNVRSYISRIISKNKYIKNTKLTGILKSSIEDYKKYLESKFEPWMNWDNYGLYNAEPNYGWDIDHIIPLSTAKTEEDVIRLNHYTNLQPLCSYINRVVKKDKLY